MLLLLKNEKTTIIAICLILVSFCLCLYKVIVLRYSFATGPSSPLWRVCFQIQFEGVEKKAKVGLLLPQTSYRQRIYDERTKDDEFKFHVKEIALGNNRRGYWEKKKLKSKGLLKYEFSVKVKGNTFKEAEEEIEVAPWLKLPGEESKKTSIPNLAQQVTEGLRNEEEKVKALYYYVRDTISDSAKRKARLLCLLLRTSNIPSRIVKGLILEEGIKKNVHFWVEAFINNKWVPFCPYNGYAMEIPTTYLILCRGNLPLIKRWGTKNLEYLITVQREKRKQLEFISNLEREELSENKWSLSSLALPIQKQVRVLLVIPLGALVVAILRCVVGINTFGTFTPLLVALAFREMKLIWGLGLFSLFIAIGCFARSILDRLKLLLVSRLSIILTLIVGVIIILISVDYHTGTEVISSVFLFPMVIMTMVIERFFITQMEVDTKTSYLLFFNTIIVACVVYSIISLEMIQLTMFFFPGLLLAVVGFLILLGRYTGLRLTELWRFKSLERK